MGLFVGSTPVKSVYVGSAPVKSVYVGSMLVWQAVKEVVQITLDTGLGARNQLRAALAGRGLDYTTVTEIPFDIELVGTGEARAMFSGCSALTSVPDMDTSSVTSMASMFHNCSSLTTVPDMDTSSVTTASYTFYYCSSLTDGNVRLIGRHPNVNTAYMIVGSGLTREPFYKADGTPDDGLEVHEVTLTNVTGSGTVHSLLTVTVPAGETWDVRIQGTVTGAPGSSAAQPFFRIGTANSGRYGQGAAVDFSGTVTAANSTIAMVTGGAFTLGQASFTGTVTIEK